MRIGRLLALWRRAHCLTLRAAAGRIGLTAGTLARLERGEAMHGATLATVLVWLMGREEPSGNETFIFEAEDAVALPITSESDIKSQRAGELERIPYKLGRTEIETGDSEAAEATCAAIAEEPEAAAQCSLHAVDQNSALCGVRPVQLGGGAHGAAGAGAEGAG